MTNNRLLFALSILLAILTACTTKANATPPQPPPIQSQADIESDFISPPWWWSEPQFVYAVQEYCAYTDQCDTEHAWLGEFWGYSYPSYQTIVYGDSITINHLYEVNMSYDGKCPKNQSRIYTDQNVTGQFVTNAEGAEIPFFCIKDLRLSTLDPN